MTSVQRPRLPAQWSGAAPRTRAQADHTRRPTHLTAPAPAAAAETGLPQVDCPTAVRHNRRDRRKGR
eukprot:3152475-Heterocapsa_arctica.AAC.1